MPGELDDIDAALAEAEGSVGALDDIDAELSRAERDRSLNQGLVFQDRPVVRERAVAPSPPSDPTGSLAGRIARDIGINIPGAMQDIQQSLVGAGQAALQTATDIPYTIGRIFPPAMSVVGSPVGRASGQAVDATQTALEEQAKLGRDVVPATLRAIGAADTFGEADEMQRRIQAEAPSVPIPFTDQTISAGDVTRAVGSLAPALALAPAGTPGILAGAMAQSGGAQYRDSIDSGKQPQEAARDAQTAAAITGLAMMVIPGGSERAMQAATNATKKISGTTANKVRQVLTGGASEFGEEGLDELAQALVIDKATMSDALERAAKGGIIGGILGTSMQSASLASGDQPAAVATAEPAATAQPETMDDIDRQLAAAEQGAASAVAPTAEQAQQASAPTADAATVDQAGGEATAAPVQPEAVAQAGQAQDVASQPQRDAGQQPGPGQAVVEPVPTVPVGDAAVADRSMPAGEAPADVGAPVEPAVVAAGEAANQVPGPVARRVDQPAKGRGMRLFEADTGTLGVPRDQMPQIASEHRGALSNYLRSRGVEWSREDAVDPNTLKPTQAEWDPAKVRKAIKRSKDGSDQRAILVSNDGHVVDGHHQWLGAMQRGATIDVVRLDAPISDLLPMVREFPSAAQEGQTNEPQGLLSGVSVDASQETAGGQTNAETPSDSGQQTVREVRPESEAAAEAVVLPPVPRGDDAPAQAEAQRDDRGAAPEGDRQELRERLPETREADAETVRGVREPGRGEAPRGLQQAPTGDVAMRPASPAAAPGEADRGRAADRPEGDRGGAQEVPADGIPADVTEFIASQPEEVRAELTAAAEQELAGQRERGIDDPSAVGNNVRFMAQILEQRRSKLAAQSAAVNQQQAEQQAEQPAEQPEQTESPKITDWQAAADEIMSPTIPEMTAEPIDEQAVLEEVEPETLPDPNTFGASQASVRAARASVLGIVDTMSPESRGFSEAMATAINVGKTEPASAMLLAHDWLQKDVGQMEDVDTAALVHHGMALQNRHQELTEQLENAETGRQGSIASELQQVEQDLEVLTRALDRRGSELGRALNAQKLRVTRSYQLAPVLIRAKLSAEKRGAKLSDRVKRQLNALVSRVQQLELDQKTLQREHNAAMAQAAIDQAKRGGRRRRRPDRKQDMQSRAEKLVKLMQEGC